LVQLIGKYPNRPLAYADAILGRRVNALNAPFAIRRRRPPRADLSLLLEVGAVVEILSKSAGSTS
jgi:hypothetical protein